jgi:DNA-binding PucR family transcriptional regulator/putative methionine-R-sulfoxide reductase with GAF domain
MAAVGGTLEAGRLGVFGRVAADILSSLELDATLLSVLNAVVTTTRADIAGILLADESNGTLKMQACTGHRTVSTARLVVRRGQGVAGKVYDEGRPIRVDDYDTDERISRDFADIAHADGTRAALGAPMAVRGRVIGVAMSWRRQPDAYVEADVQAMTTLADLAAIAVENARLYEAERETVEGLQVANQRLATRNENLRRATEVHDELMRLVLEGVPLGDLVGGVARMLDADVATLDASCRVMAVSGAAGAALKPRMAARIAARDPVPSDDDRLLVRDVVAGGERLGYLGVALRHPPVPLDIVLVEQATIMCALELTRERAVLQARTRVRGDFLWDLLDGKIADVAEALVWARALHLELPERVRVALIRARARPRDNETDGALPQLALRESLAQVAERAATAQGGEAALAAARGSLIALLLPATDDPRARVEAVVDRLGERFPQIEIAAGVSATAATIGELPDALAQAQIALNAAPTGDGCHHVAVLDELGVMRFLLAPGDRGDLREFAHGVLGEVLDYDRGHPSDLTHTIEAYLGNDCNLQRTAAAIFVHPKTVRYRLDKVQDLAGLDFASQRDRFEAQLAISIMRTLELQESNGR